MRLHSFAFVTGLLALGGCATENPEWLKDPHTAFCLHGITTKCITELGSASWSEGADPQRADSIVPELGFGMSLLGEGVELEGIQSASVTAAFAQGAGLVRNASKVSDLGVIQQIRSLDGEDAQSYSLSMLVLLKANDLDESVVSEGLNILHDLNHEKYLTALATKLPKLLRHGDLERAAALRELLLDARNDKSRPYSMLAFVMGAYAHVGLQSDALGILSDEMNAGREFTNAEISLIKIVSRSAASGYPSPHDFLTLRSDQVRIDAYLTIAALALCFEDAGTTKKALSDAVRFTQKSSVDIDRSFTLAHLLALTAATKDLVH